MSQVGFKKWPCRRVEFSCPDPYLPNEVLLRVRVGAKMYGIKGPDVKPVASPCVNVAESGGKSLYLAKTFNCNLKYLYPIDQGLNH